MLMFTFGNALARAHILYGVRRSTRPNVLSPSAVLLELKKHSVTPCVCVFQTQPQSVLNCPITVQAVGTNGRIFQFLVFQLNTTDLTGDHGVKNQVSAQCPEQNRTAPSCG